MYNTVCRIRLILIPLARDAVALSWHGVANSANPAAGPLETTQSRINPSTGNEISNQDALLRLSKIRYWGSAIEPGP